jgi:hypothetical protein
MAKCPFAFIQGGKMAENNLTHSTSALQFGIFDNVVCQTLQLILKHI